MRKTRAGSCMRTFRIAVRHRSSFSAWRARWTPNRFPVRTRRAGMLATDDVCHSSGNGPHDWRAPASARESHPDPRVPVRARPPGRLDLVCARRAAARRARAVDRRRDRGGRRQLHRGAGRRRHPPVPGRSARAHHEHEEIGELSFYAASALGIVALAALVRWRREPLPNPAWLGVLVGTLAVSGMMGYTGLLGGQVRHTEVRAGATPADAIAIEPRRTPVAPVAPPPVR